MKAPENKEQWLIDEPAADVVRKIYSLCLAGRGPLQIAKQLEKENILIPSAGNEGLYVFIVPLGFLRFFRGFFCSIWIIL